MMKIGQSIQCPSCGASSVIKHDNQPIIECEYCGSMMRFTPNSTSSEKTKPAKLTFLLIMVPVIVVALMIVFWMVFQNIRKHTNINDFTEQPNVQTDRVAIKPSIQNEGAINSSFDLKKQLTIDSQTAGTTSLGHKYWIFSVTNQGPKKIARPGVMVSIFDEGGKRIVEQGGWAYKDILAAGESTVVFVFVKEAPESIADIQLSSLASKPNASSENQLNINVEDYTIKQTNLGFEFIGDVKNQHQVDVKYTRVVVIAYDKEGVPVGVGNGFSTEKQLMPEQNSGFKVKVNTFLAGEPHQWDVWAIARY